MEKIKFSSNNCNARSGNLEVNYSKIANYILNNNINLFSLNEIKDNGDYNLNELLGSEYDLILNDAPIYLKNGKEKTGNQILIGIKKTLNMKVVAKITADEYFATLNNKPNFLAVKVQLEDGSFLTIVGMRITIDNGTIEDAKDRMLQLNAITKYLKTIPSDEKILGAADWNCYSDYDLQTKAKNITLCQHYYNSEIINETLLVSEITLLTPEEGYSYKQWYSRENNPEIKYPCEFKLDRIFTRNINAKNDDAYYDITFRDEHFDKNQTHYGKGFDHNPIIIELNYKINI